MSRRCSASLGLALLALRAAGAVDPGALLHDVQSHVQTLAGQLRQLFVHVCRPTDVEMLHLEPATFFSIEKEDEVQLPSCPAMRDAGLETYYGNLALPPRRCARRKR